MSGDHPPVSPQPISLSLPCAARAAIRAGTLLQELNLQRWADTYHSTPAEVERTFTAELTKETNANAIGDAK